MAMTTDFSHECEPARWSLCPSTDLPYAFSEMLSDCALSYGMRLVRNSLFRAERAGGPPASPVVRLEVHDWSLAELAAELAEKYGLQVAYTDLEDYN
jgi:hypothetical protein